MMRRVALALAALVVVASPALATGTSRNLPGTTCPAFPANSYWHADISRLPVNTRSAQWMSHKQAGFRGDTTVVLRAMRSYGLVLADNGSPWYSKARKTPAGPRRCWTS